jgi:hypothetical protein
MGRNGSIVPFMLTPIDLFLRHFLILPVHLNLFGRIGVRCRFN